MSFYAEIFGGRHQSFAKNFGKQSEEITVPDNGDIFSLGNASFIIEKLLIGKDTIMETEKDLEHELKDDLGDIELMKCVAPGIYYVVAVDPEEAVPAEYYIVDKDCRVVSSEAKAYGVALEYHDGYIGYRADVPEDGRMVLEYEINRYLVKSHLPPLDGDTILSIVTYGREHNPEYFGDYPAPTLTPRGFTLRYLTLTSGVFLIETDKLEKCLPFASRFGNVIYRITPRNILSSLTLIGSMASAQRRAICFSLKKMPA